MNTNQKSLIAKSRAPWLWHVLALLLIAAFNRWKSGYHIIVEDAVFFISLLILPIVLAALDKTVNRVHTGMYALFNVSLLLVFFSPAQPTIVIGIVIGAMLLLHFTFNSLLRSLLQPAAFVIMTCVFAAQFFDVGILMITHSNPLDLWPYLIAVILMLWDRSQNPFRQRALLTIMLLRMLIIAILLWLQVHFVLSICVGVAIGNLLSPLLDTLLEAHEPRKT
jgi:hypothetical protein